METCTMCGKRLDRIDLQNDFYWENNIHYGSRHDEERIRFRLCCDCFDKVMDILIPMCKENPIIDDDISRNYPDWKPTEDEKQQIYENMAKQYASEILEKHVEAFKELAK